jgi:hypothetical protein
MHELGHTLGLFHGGHDSKPYKPHYFSVMNYLFQEGSIKRDLDYSRCEINLNENNLNEFDGIIDNCKNSRDSRFFTKSNCNLNSPLSQLRHIVTNTKINWNTNGQYEQFVEHDVNCDRSKDQRLNALNDWKGICYVCPLKSNEENADFIEESPTFKEEKTSLQQLEEELSYEDAIDLRYAATVGFINDTLNSLPSSVFQSNISNTQDESSFMFDSEESSVNESSLIKQSIASMLGVGSNENRTAITDDNLFLDEAVVDINVTREIYDNNPDAAIDGLETILQITDSYLNRTGEDDWVAGKENQKQFGDAILSAIDSLQRQSCTYTKCG